MNRLREGASQWRPRRTCRYDNDDGEFAMKLGRHHQNEQCSVNYGTDTDQWHRNASSTHDHPSSHARCTHHIPVWDTPRNMPSRSSRLNADVDCAKCCVCDRGTAHTQSTCPITTQGTQLRGEHTARMRARQDRGDMALAPTQPALLENSWIPCCLNAQVFACAFSVAD